MENKKVSKKGLRSLIRESLQQSIVHLELPKPNKKVKKIIDRTTRKLAGAFVDLAKKESRKGKSKKSKPKKIKTKKAKSAAPAAKVS